MKCFKLTLRLIGNERIEVLVEAENILNLLENLSGNKFSFVNKERPNDKSFSIFTHAIQRIDYETISVMPFERSQIHTIHTSF